jgi:hypothetical protein
MNNTTKIPVIFFLSKEAWFEAFRPLIQQQIDVSLIPICIIGALLNILALIVLRSDKFNLPFYTYLRAYTFASIVICLINGTQFSAGARTLLEFTNSIGTARYYAYIFYPFQVILNIYGSLLDIALSMERVVLLSKRFEWFKKIRPNVLCLIFFAVSFIISTPYAILFRTTSVKVNLNLTETFVIHQVIFSRYIVDIKEYFLKMPYIVDIFPIIMETFFNILSIYLVRQYTKNKMETMGTNKLDGTPIGGIHRLEKTRAKTMEIKLTILVIFLSTLSTM